LWGSHFEVQARQNLRQALSRLRRALGEEALISNGDEISFAPGMIDCDAARLEGLVRKGSPTSLAEAVDLYQQRLLTDVTIAEEAWTDWVAGERQRLEGWRSMPSSGSRRSNCPWVTRTKRSQRPIAHWQSIIFARTRIA
jgi:DNA-binding SARP family transcriptional activator